MGQRTSQTFYAAIIGLCVFSAGCHTVNSTERSQSQATPNVVEDYRILTDGDLKSKAAIVQVIEGRTSGLLKIQAEIRNTTLTRQGFNYRFEWIDQEGMLVSSQMSSWKQVSLAAKESTMISGIAPTPKVVDFKLKLIQLGH